MLSLVIYGFCAVALFRLAGRPRDRVVAILGLVFSVAAVAAAAPGYILPTLAFFALTSLAWLRVRRNRRDIDSGTGRTSNA